MEGRLLPSVCVYLFMLMIWVLNVVAYLQIYVCTHLRTACLCFLIRNSLEKARMQHIYIFTCRTRLVQDGAQLRLSGITLLGCAFTAVGFFSVEERDVDEDLFVFYLVKFVTITGERDDIRNGAAVVADRCYGHDRLREAANNPPCDDGDVFSANRKFADVDCWWDCSCDHFINPVGLGRFGSYLYA